MVHKVKIRTQSDRNCPVCENSRVEIFYEVNQMPVHPGLLWPDREDALSVPKGDLRMAFCPVCGHIFNAAYNPDLIRYNDWYENSLHFSSRFQSYARANADRLIERYDLRKKDLIELGSGRSDFLELLCELGENRGIGFDPGYTDDPGIAPARQRVTFVQNITSDQYTRYQADLICCRGLLERLSRPREFVGALRRDIGDRRETIGFIEASNCIHWLENCLVWDLAYEDFSCFTPVSMDYLFTNNGFDIIERGSARDGEILTLEVRPRVEERPGVVEPDPGSLETLRSSVLAFKAHSEEISRYWKTRLEEWKASEKKAVLWGTGPRQNTFLNALKIEDTFLHVVDLDPRNRGLHVAGSGHRVVSPAALRSLRPDAVIIMDEEYESEVRQLIAAMDLAPEFLEVVPLRESEQEAG